MAKKKVSEESKRLLATVSGMKIYSDSVYVVTGKMDEGAPDGFQREGISKAPFPGNKYVTPCSWDKYLSVYDTGFFENSSCFKGMNDSEIESEVKLRNKNIRFPYETATGENLDQSNFDFWDSFSVKVYDGRLFYTKDINDLFDLYIALQAKALTPKDEDGNPDFQGSMYCVEDKTTAVDVKKQRQLDKTEIIYKFMSMLNGDTSDKQTICDLLLFLDIIYSVEVDPEMVRYSFTNWIEAKNTNVDAYKEAYRRYVETEENTDIIHFHRMIKEMVYSGLIRVGTDGVVFDGVNLGGDMTSAAMALSKDKSLIEVKANILSSYNALKDKQRMIAEGKS